VDIEALTRKMRKDKSLNLEKLNARLGPDVFQQIYQPLAATGLLSFLTQLPVRNIPDYVAEFYYNTTVNDDNIISTVKNQVILVTKDTMMSTLHLPDSGPDVMNLNLPSKHELWKIWKLPRVLHNDSSHILKESLQSDIIQLPDITSHVVHGNFDIVHLSEIKAHITAALCFGCQRAQPQGPSSSDNGKAPLEATVSSTNERELLLENASLLRLSDQPTISASSQPPPLVQSDYIEVDFEAYHIWRFQLDESTMFHLIHTRGSAFWISEGTWSRNWMNHPLSLPPTLSEIMDSMIKQLQLGISADAPLPDNEPANSSYTPFVGDHHFLQLMRSSPAWAP
ncbi:hypothetical protein C2S51_010248, partial [Perilla frutescens var. frutescens]